LINPVGDLKAYLLFSKVKLYCPAHHPHDNTYVLLQERKPVRLWTGFALYIFAEHFLQSSINISSYFILIYQLILAYFVGQKIPPFLL
jgi:hypothetical protein